MTVLYLLPVPSHTLEPRVVGDGDLLAQVDEHGGQPDGFNFQPTVLEMVLVVFTEI